MPPVIRISDELYNKLEKLAVGFDTPTAVIERLVNIHGNVDVSQEKWAGSKALKKPELVFYPSEDEFKFQLIEKKVASVVLYMKDGSSESLEWRANRFSSDSNLRANLWSGYLRGWEEKGIVKAEFTVHGDMQTKEYFPKIGRIKKWAEKKDQINNKIISTYLKLSQEKECISLEELRTSCCEVMTTKQFSENYASMKTDAGNAHGRVFYERGEDVFVYPQIKCEIDRWWNK